MKDSSGQLSRSWIWLLVLFTYGSLIETVFFGQISAFTPLYLPDLGVPAGAVAAWTGIIASVAGIIGLPFLPFWGALADRYSRKPIIIRSYLAHLLAAIVAFLAGNVWLFLVGRSISSLALGNSGLMMTTLSERAPSNRQGLAFSIMNSAAPIGIFLGPLVGGPIMDRWDFRTLLVIDIVLLITVILSMAGGYKDFFKGGEQKPVLSMAGDSLRILMASRRLKALFPALFVLFSGWMLALTYVPLAVAQIYPGQNLGTIVGIVLGAGGFLALFVSPFLGAMADRFGYWRILFIGAILEVILWPLPALVHGILAFGIAWALINGLGSGVFSISFTVLAQSAEEKVRGRVMSFAYLPVNVGGIVGPAIGSLITRGSVMMIFPVAAGLTVVGILLMAVAQKRAV